MSKSGWIAVLGMLVLGGCTAQHDYAATASCQPERIAEIPVTMTRNVPLVTVAINDKPARMMIDSGSDRSLISAEAAARLGLRGDPLRAAMSQGIGGSNVNAGFIADTLEASGLVLDRPTFGTAITQWSLPGDKPDGIIGSDVLSRFDVDLDFTHGHLVLYRARTCPDAGPAWDGAHRTLRLTRADSAHDLYGVQLRLNGTEIFAIVDTGAEFTAISPGLAAELGVSGPAGSDRAIHATGVGEKVVGAFTHQFTSLVIGGQTTRGPNLVVLDLPAPARMLLGEDYWLRHRTWLAYARGRMFVQRE